MMGWLIHLTKGYRWRLALSIGLGSLTIFSSIGLLGTSAYLIAMAAYQPSIAVLQVAIVGVRFFGISRSVFRYLERLVTHSVNLKVLASLRSWIFENLLNKYPIREGKLSHAAVLAAIVQSVDVLENFYVRLFSPIAVAGIVSLSTALFFGLYSIELCFIILFGLGLSGFLLPWLAGKSGEARADRLEQSRLAYQEAILSFSDSFQELTLLQAGDDYLKQIETLEREWARQKNQQNVLQAGFGMLSFYSTQGVFLLIMVVTAGLVINDSIEAVMMAVLSLISLASFEAVVNLPISAQLLGEVGAAVHQIRKLDLTGNADATLEIEVPSKDETSAGLVIKNLRFRYSPLLEDCLSEVNLQLKPGQKIAIVGENGSGKSTLLNILLGFYADYEGEIFIDGIHSREISDFSKRTYFSAVGVAPYFFDTSLLQNFQLANPSLDSAQAQTLLQAVGLGRVAQQRDQSILEFIHDRVRFSGGEGQRFDIARALARPAQVYLFDEATANLDPLISKEIMETLFTRLSDQSMLFITHHYFLMDRFDEIIVLKGGKIVERGSHQALLALNGYYHHLYAAHFPEIPDNLSH